MQGIIFDLDGTLWDSAENVAISWDRVVKDRYPGLLSLTSEDIMGVMGKTMTQIARIFFHQLSEEEADQLLLECCEDENSYLREKGGVLYPHLEETLKDLSSEYELFIVSNCQKGYIEAFLEHYGFEKYFKDIECFGNTGEEKDCNIRRVAERNHLKGAVYVGDIQGDYDATTRAGLPFIHARYGFGRIDAPVPGIDGLDELRAVVKEILK